MAVRLDVQLKQPQFILNDLTVGIGDIPFAIIKALHFTANQDNASFELIDDEVFESSLPVLNGLWTL